MTFYLLLTRQKKANEIKNHMNEDKIIIDQTEEGIGLTQEKLRKTNSGLMELKNTRTIKSMCILILLVMIVLFCLQFTL